MAPPGGGKEPFCAAIFSVYSGFLLCFNGQRTADQLLRNINREYCFTIELKYGVVVRQVRVGDEFLPNKMLKFELLLTDSYSTIIWKTIQHWHRNMNVKDNRFESVLFIITKIFVIVSNNTIAYRNSLRKFK